MIEFVHSMNGFGTRRRKAHSLKSWAIKQYGQLIKDTIGRTKTFTSKTKAEAWLAMQDNTAKRAKLLRYLEGWKVGAAFLTIPPELNEDEDFGIGWMDGKNARNEATVAAQHMYNYKLAVLRIEEPIDV